MLSDTVSPVAMLVDLAAQAPFGAAVVLFLAVHLLLTLARIAADRIG